MQHIPEIGTKTRNASHCKLVKKIIIMETYAKYGSRDYESHISMSEGRDATKQVQCRNAKNDLFVKSRNHLNKESS